MSRSYHVREAQLPTDRKRFVSRYEALRRERITRQALERMDALAPLTVCGWEPKTTI